ncbi:MAG: energy transducer TonB, partial [Acidobacteria bacterium]|nr:energy transducer TonB [Acidobacteriota bacterium]
VIKAPDPEYSTAAREAGIQGTVFLWVVVCADGRVGRIRVERSLDEDLDQNAVRTVRQWRFRPALKDGKPVAVQVNIEVNFRLF